MAFKFLVSVYFCLTRVTLQFHSCLPGAYGEVRKCLSKETNALRAVKIINKKYLEKTQEEQLLSEISILKQMDHPNILKLYEFF